jgi:predicted TIM-barrel fold metal-dependent hydrolase
MLSHPLVRTHVLFGSDYYMVTQERMSEKEVSVMLRSRLGEELYKQIAYTNPREFLGLEAHEVKVNRTTRKKNSTRR